MKRIDRPVAKTNQTNYPYQARALDSEREGILLPPLEHQPFIDYNHLWVPSRDRASTGDVYRVRAYGRAKKYWLTAWLEYEDCRVEELVPVCRSSYGEKATRTLGVRSAVRLRP